MEQVSDKFYNAIKLEHDKILTFAASSNRVYVSRHDKSRCRFTHFMVEAAGIGSLAT
jgi:hypothetical protein